MGLGSDLPSSVAITCRYKEDAGTQDDVVSSLVELAGCDAESSHEKQNHAQDWENARGPHSPCGTWRVRERERENMAVKWQDAGGRREGSTREWGFYGGTRVEVA